MKLNPNSCYVFNQEHDRISSTSEKPKTYVRSYISYDIVIHIQFAIPMLSSNSGSATNYTRLVLIKK